MKTYDYIICGAGCAGLTFLYEILAYKNLANKNILIIDATFKTENDRTWCFWQQENNVFEKIVKHKWNNLHFEAVDHNNTFSINPYYYKIINGLDFYNFVLNFASSFKNVVFAKEKIIEIENTASGAVVKTNQNTYLSNYVFNSIIFDESALNTKNSLLQHFKGIIIETTEPVFSPTEATFMDFTVSQQNGTTFMYVLPTSSTRALVEYTLFTKFILKEEEYDAALQDYIKNKLQITDYRIVHTEFGIIPMTDFKFPTHNGNIINIGTAAGCVKSSSGFAFRFIQKYTKQIIELLIQGKKPIVKRTFNDKKFHFYDSVLLEVIAQNKMQGSEIFTSIFKRNSPQLVLKFLDNETNIWEDIKIMSSVPMKVFLPIAIRKLFAV